MKNTPPVVWLGFVLLFVSTLGGNGIQAQEPPPSTPVTQPAKPPVIGPVPTETKTVDVPAVQDKKVSEPPATGEQKKNPESKMVSDPKNDRGPYIIGPEDVLLIRIWQEPNISGQVTVGPDGMISLQLLDEVKAEGLTPEQLKRSLTEKLKTCCITDPDVNVQVVRVNSRKFIIQGEVLNPGSFPLTGATTVFEALVFGKGFKEFAKPNKIYVLRQEVDANAKNSVPKRFKFNYKEVSQGKHMEQNILIKNGDVIFVP